MKKYLFAAGLIACIHGGVYSAQTGAQFLKIDTDARLSGMASAGAVSANGISALNYNPAGLSSIKGPEVAFSHSKWLMDASHDFAGFGLDLKNNGRGGLKLGVGITRLSSGEFNGRSENREASGGYTSYEQAASLGFALGGIGGAIKYVQGHIADEHAATWAVDMGAKTNLSRLPVAVGFGVRNLGPGLKYISQRDPLPLSANAGFTVAAFPGVTLAFNVNRYVYDKRTILSAGTEYAMLNAEGGLGFALRGGYGLMAATADDGSNGLSMGAGLTALGATLDYAVTPQTGLGAVQRITLKKKF